jgi:hypothetical protein
VRSGTVVSAGPEGGYGNRVRIKLDTGEEIGYAHMSEIGVKAGDVLEAGDVIGRSGGKPGTPGAGSSTGSHLHFSVQNAEGMMIDPMPWLKNGGIEPSRLGMMGIGGGEPLPSKTVTLNVNVKVDSTNLSDASEDEIKGAVLEAIKTDEIRKILANPVLVN